MIIATTVTIWGRYHEGRRPSSDNSFHSPTVIPLSALDKPSIMKRYHRRWTCSHTSPRRSPTMVTLSDTRFVDCQWWNDDWTVKTVVTWRLSGSMIPAPDLRASGARPGSLPFSVSMCNAYQPRHNRRDNLRSDRIGVRTRFPRHASGIKKTGTPVLILLSAWCYKVNTRTGRLGVSLLWLVWREPVWSVTSISVRQHVQLPTWTVPEIHLYIAGMLSEQASSRQHSG